MQRAKLLIAVIKQKRLKFVAVGVIQTILGQ